MQTATMHSPMKTVHLNAEMYRSLGQIAEDESLMQKALKYVQKLAASKAKADETEYIMSSPRMVEILQEGDEEIASGKLHPIALDDLWK